jgi:ketosteroid isomerase-like protein
MRTPSNRHPSGESIPRQWFRRVWNELDTDAIDELFAPDGVAHGLDVEPVRGPAGFRVFHQAFVASFRDIHIEVLQELTEGDMVALRCAVTAVSVAQPGQAPKVRQEGMVFCRVREGRIVEAWNSWDFAALLEQMGLLPARSLALALSGRMQPHPQVAAASRHRP